MVKILRFIASLGLVITPFNINNYANAHDSNSKLAHLDGESDFSHARSLTKFQVSGSQNLEFQTAKVGISDGNRSIPSQGQWLQINFNPPMFVDSKLKIDFNSLDRNILTESPVYFSCGGSIRKSTDLLSESCFSQVY